ncbi:hypothetical protein A3F07_01380 [candidate division WWE3 bacterium RIFCSPHIGHO2_12_FULL_38_15]|uniref:Uncharacterized protein n=1 Tax=candidate division WWE3 bacterium RIFCSPHIGHO2_02_FULL_38_14 TaxID=1802620 RepID=A0A1F4V942_UNCKA|nr:MAG: hypothetical protein A2793_01915 [candidate division WWE3 bacterium RIFCSPHIGHO2_01_FULL_38_45]OGC48358.1 MAG: hypothetical protein A3F07_01380 [candidate division WWE3 bacterium RIFCSPHIGHO2_12_FULL_38_15]OGC53664.1 MAG: hypothetical protein A3D91_04470 [candidate division WWE3 bacterium RIFCSPHIGHO2_02_FULL_38_14]OGC54293.1 MAG: hypothetical protein A3B64_02180 [candidate division WWE3 bacterium RIFCSPLOWO2_01_FULL_37_24]HLB51537.1 Nramp family divalent metal transporter [Patescibacte
MNLKPLNIKEFPKALPLKKLLGPSFILLGLGLGSGEVILWPFLASNFGLGIIWGAIVGITFQFFMNMEIERYALINGESIFVGFARKLKWLPFWFILSSFVPWIWPGIAASSAKLFGAIIGIENTSGLTIILLVLIGLILSLGPILYKTVESLQKILIAVGVPSIFILAIILANESAWGNLAKGVVGIGENYLFLPLGIPLATFLAAFAYSGAGGNLNLAQSYYIKEKGYGMGKYSGKITSLLTGKKEEVSLSGSTFEANPENVTEFKRWWKNINIEHFLVFWLTGTATILLLALLSYSTTYNTGQSVSNINFVISEANVIAEKLAPFMGTFFLLITGLTLFGTQLTVFDATSRILSENIILASGGRLWEKHIRMTYYTVLWLQIIAGIFVLLLGFTEPLQLVVTAAVLNAFAMFVHVGLTLWLNKTSLAPQLKPSAWRVAIMTAAFLIYGGFSIYTIADKLF